MYLLQYLFIILTYILSLAACPQQKAKPQVEKLRFPLGDKEVVFTKTVYKNAGDTIFLQLHDNELTAEASVLEYISDAGGVLLSIENEGSRNVSFTLQNTSYTFDPNRIFTAAGLQATLQRLGDSSPEAMAAVKAFADSILNHLPQSALIIAVHNNTDENFSINSYVSDTTYMRDAAAVHTNPSHDVDDFFLTTDTGLYSQLVALNYNTILQNNEGATDDGSLSVYLGKKGIRYVNVEAEHGHGTFQLQMIKRLLQSNE